MDNPLAPLVKIRGNLANVVSEHGLRIEQFVVIPGKNPQGPHRVSVKMFTTEDDQPDAIEVKMAEMARKEEQEEKAKHREEKLGALPQALEQIEQDLEGGGLL
jgi:hypothetical protein